MTTYDPGPATSSPAGDQAGQPGSTDCVYSAGPIKRLEPADGLFLRAEHLAQIQRYARQLARAVARAGGAGVAYGLTAAYMGGDPGVVTVSDGLAIDPAGAPLLLDTAQGLPLPAAAAGGEGAAAGRQIWVIELLAAERALDDTESLYGALCDCSASGVSGTIHPYVAEGLCIRFRPANLDVPGVPDYQFRSAVAAAWYRREHADGSPLIPTLRGDGTHAALASQVWATGTSAAGGDAVPIGVLLHTGTAWEVDVWIARRDQVDPPPRRGWQQRMGMRPWDVFLAQVLQFQAQLAVLDIDPVLLRPVRYPAEVSAAVEAALADVNALEEIVDQGKSTTVTRRGVSDRVKSLLAKLAAAKAESLPGGKQGLLELGFIELPPAGYLPVSPVSGATVNEQVSRLMGDGVILRFCSVRPDQVSLALEQAQHLDRISLTQGLQDPKQRAEVDVLVPDGVLGMAAPAGHVHFAEGDLGYAAPRAPADEQIRHHGLGRFEKDGMDRVRAAFAGVSALVDESRHALWLDLQLDPDPFTLPRGGSASVQARLAYRRAFSETPDGEADWRADVSTELLCQRVRADAMAGTTTFEGQLTGGLVLCIAGQCDDRAVDIQVQLELKRTAGQVSELTMEAVTTQGKNQWRLQFDLSLTTDGYFTVKLADDTTTGIPLDLLCNLAENPQAVRPGQAARTDAEEALKDLSNTEFPLVAVSRLFADAPPPADPTGFRTVHDWVLFTRRPTCACEPVRIGTVAAPTIRLDLYTVALANPARALAAGKLPQRATPEFVATLEWDSESYWVTPQSRIIVDGWAAATPPPAAPLAALVWLDLRAPHDFLVKQVLSRMGAADDIKVSLRADTPLVPLSPLSAGAILAVL
jgi:hypothetical protein